MSSEFMRNFMAGWGMGQQRLDNQRRDEMMARQAEQEQYARQQEMEDRALRQQHLKLQEEEIRHERKRAQFEDALKEADLRRQATEFQGMVAPPTAADVGIQQTTPADVGPTLAEINVPQPTQAVPSLTGGADIPVPIPTGRQQEELALRAQQQKMREALGLKVAEREAMEPFEQAKFEREAGLKRELAGKRTAELAKVLGAFGTAKTEGQQNKVEIAQYGVSKMPGWQKFITDNKDKFGFYAGRATKVAQSGALRPIGVKPSKEMGKFSSELANVSSAMLNALSGAAISPQEFERLKQFIPQLEDEPEMLEAKMATLDDYFKFRLRNFNAPYQGAGWQENPPPSAPASGGVNPAVAPLLSMYGVDIFSGEE